MSAGGVNLEKDGTPFGIFYPTLDAQGLLFNQR